MTNNSDRPDEFKLHKYAIEGKKGKLKAILNKLNQNINALDLNGSTALYYACLNRKKACAKLLLDYNADPNERSIRGRTPLHAAAITGDVKLLYLLVGKGADLRLHDDDGRTARDLANCIKNPELRKAFLEALDMAPVIPAPKMIGESQQTSLCPSLGHCVPSQNEYVNLNSTKKTNESGSNVSLNYIDECELTHDAGGLTTNNGAFMVYEAMKWKEKLLVTVKRLHLTPVDGAYVDLLIQEQNILSHISYPKIVQLIGIARSPLCERQSLVFERIHYGSLFNILHENQSKGVKIRNLVEIISSICEAIIYLHEQRIIHCYINSHSVLMVTAYTPKLANFEYAVPKAIDINQQKRSKVVENKHTNYAWNWIAPELMKNELPHEKCDMYSFCAFVWELFNLTIPWKDMEWNEIYSRIHEHNESLPVDLNLIPLPFNRILKDGLSYNTIKRMSFNEVKDTLDSFRQSIRSKNIQLKMSKKNVYTNDVKKPKSGMIYTDYGAETINDTPVANEMATYNSEDFENRSQFSSKSFITCDAYKAEFHLTKSGLSVISKETRHKDKSSSKNHRAHSSQHERSKRKHNTSENVNKSPKSTDYHMDSIGLVSVTPKNSKIPVPPPPPPPTLPPPPSQSHSNHYGDVYNNDTNIPPAPPLPLPPNQINISQAKSSKLAKSSKKQQQQPVRDTLPQHHTLTDEPSSQSSRNTQQFMNQSKFTSITDPPSELPMPSSYLTPNSTPKFDLVSGEKRMKSSKQQPVSSNQMIEELKTRNGSSSRLSQMTDQLDSSSMPKPNALDYQLRKVEAHEQQQLIQQKQEQQLQLLYQQHQLQQQQQQQLSMHNAAKLISDYEFSSSQPNPTSSTPINLTRTRQMFQQRLSEFDRESMFRVSNNSYTGINDNIMQPTTVDPKFRDFEPVNHQQLNKNSSRKQESESSDDEEIQAVKDNNYSNNIFGGSLPRNSSINEAKKIYSNVRKSTIVSNKTDEDVQNATTNMSQIPGLKQTGSSVSVAQLVNDHMSMSQASNTSLTKPPQQDVSQRKPVNKLKQQQNRQPRELNSLIRGGSYNRLNDAESTSNKAIFWELKSISKESLVNESNNKLPSESGQMNDFISKRSSSFSDSRSQLRNQSNGNGAHVIKAPQLHQSRFSKQNEQNENNNTNNNIQFCTNFGSVKNLVKSYESYKEQNENEQRMRSMREARNKEISDAVESSKAALAAQQQQQLLNEQLEQQKLEEQKFQHQQQIEELDQNNNKILIKPEQAIRLQKELSTISERTEQSSSNHNTNHQQLFNGAQAKAAVAANNSSNSNVQAPSTVSPPNTNLSNSKATTNTTTASTKSIRNLNLLSTNQNENLYNVAAGVANTSSSNANLANSSNTSGLMSTPKSFTPLKADSSALSIQTSSKQSTKTDKQQSCYYYSKGQFLKLESIQDSEQNDYYQIKSVQKEHHKDVEDEESENLNEHYNSRYLKSTHDTSKNTSVIQDKIDRSNLMNNSVKNRVNNRSNYSSQEDFLSSMNNADLSIEASESVYLTVFDKANKRHDSSLNLKNKNAKTLESERLEADDEEQPFPSIPEFFTRPTNDNNDYTSTAMTPPPPPPMPIASNFSFNVSNSKQTKHHNDSNVKTASFTNRPAKESKTFPDTSSSSSSLAVGSSASSLAASHSNTTSSCKNSSNTNVRLEQHYIDASKYKGYQYKLETRSNVSNLYHIESSLTNANTGHSLVLAKTRVQTPKISTKIIIDR